MTTVPNRRSGGTSTSAAQPLVIACSLRRLACPNHGVRIEQVPFARPGTRVTYDFENLVVWCVTSMDRTAATVLCRVAWRTINKIIERVVPATPDLSRIKDLVHIGVDEISWKRGHKYLTLVVNHDTGDVIWGAKDRTAVTLEKFFEALGPDKTAELEAISMDFGAPLRESSPRVRPQRGDLSGPVPRRGHGHQSPRRNPPRSRR
jgi:transposase